MTEQHDLLLLAQEAARRAAEHIRSSERPPDPATWDLKGTSDFVTTVDREAEELIGETLLAGAPASIIMGEELSPEAAGAELVWIVDPLDGTTNYLHGYPAFGVSVAATVDGVLTVGVVVDVTRGIVYHAARGSGAWCGDRQLAVSHVSEPAHALIGTGFPFKVLRRLPQYLRQFDTILRTTSGIRRAGAASLDLVDLACGRFDGFWELYLAPWDIAAGALIIREAGGVITDLEGSGEVTRHGAIVAGNPPIHAWLLEVLHREAPHTE
ncbi:MAG: inositol monophosphatase [Gemmatimonadales bacterium]|nr:inositol monophosphatase [Gemmatimonadales bacterium]NIN11193.1 inositol monophosphatase [Gemmatimonadales bacterium]NIN49792.1 inositol monophosphatase [Gemmatimonadales bacterium]NIP07256.1 inositol monophosphatase [Gemmatimonadales bacterium]NIR02951.1 inositol monophosphatase [Gemmatimonadales bacterium]